MSAALKLNSTPPSEDFYELLFHEANDAIMIVDESTGKISTVNRRMLDLTGFLRNELESASVNKLFPDENTKTKTRSTLLSSNLLKHSGFYEDIALKKKDGFLSFATLSIKTLSSEKTGGRAVSFCILHDIGEKKSMERDLLTKHWELKNAYTELERAHIELKSAQEALVQAGKLAALGELAAGVAHELNQPLSGVLGFAQELEKTFKSKFPDATALDFIAEIKKNGTRIKKIVQQLREFTRRNVEDLQEVDISSVIKDSLKLLEQQFKSRGIDVSIKKDPKIPKLYCNPFQLEQVFINLATNARDAIEATGRGSGKIAIEMRQQKDKRFVEITFTDDGIGMSAEIKNKALEPFYTTKEVGKGTGLGLSVSYGIIAKIHGTILIESTEGAGTTFRIVLPVDFRTLNDKENS
jgi:PAS domain S-box-containing protein